MPTIGLIVDLRHVLTCGGDDAPGVKLHRRHGVIVGVGVVDGSGTEVPYLDEMQVSAYVGVYQIGSWLVNKMNPYPDAAVQAAGHEVHIVKL